MSKLLDIINEAKYPELLPKSCDKFKIGAHYAPKSVDQLLDIMVQQNATAASFFTSFPKNYNLSIAKVEYLSKFYAEAKKRGYSRDQFIPHAPYVCNLISENQDVRKKAFPSLLNDAYMVRMMGLGTLNFHPGSNPIIKDEDKCLAEIGEAINKIHQIVPDLVMVLECMAGSKSGSVKGCTFAQIRKIIDSVVDKKRVGVTIDTCHVYAAGFVGKDKFFLNLIKQFDEVVGRQYLAAFHLNDCQPDYGSHVDRHANIGQGTIGVQGFKDLFSHKLVDYPYILETPNETDEYAEEIQLVKKLWEQ